jgi:interferon-induced transmembrane protein
MYCNSCGAANDNNARQCVACGQPLQASPAAVTDPIQPVVPTAAPTTPIARPHVPNNLVWAILCTLFCCLPGGIVAIVYAAQVDGKIAAGDIAGAQASARNAAMWCWVSAGCGVVIYIICFFFGFLGALANH